jgi:TPP-dependent 2-oxoacid decarboxylase
MTTSPQPTSAPEQQSPSTVAGYLLDRLAALGVRHIFGVPGDYNLALLEVIEAHPTLEWIGTANELNAAYAADGYARIRGMAALVTTYGVGELSAMNGIAGSFAECVPVLHIAGVPSTEIQRKGLHVHHSLLDGDSGHFHRAYQEITCADAEITADNAAAEIDRVLAEIDTQKRPGYLSLPADLVAAPVRIPSHRLAPAHRAAAPTQFRAHVEKLLDGADRVAVLVDFLAQRHGVGSALEELIRTRGLVWATTTTAKGTVDETTPGFQGLYLGALSEPAVQTAIEDADVIIGAGLHLADLSTGGFTAKLDPSKLIDLQPAHAVVAGDVIEDITLAVAVEELTNIVPPRRCAASTSAPFPVRTSADSVDPALTPDPTGAPLTQDAFWRRFEGFIKPDDILAPEQGTAFYGVLGLRLPAGVDVITQPLWASIGYTLPALLGAHLATGSRRRAVLVIGDGSLQMTVQELGTIVRHGLDPIIIVLNNSGYTVERAIKGWTAGYNDIARWNLTELPSAFGARDAVVRHVSTLAELDDVLKDSNQLSGHMRFIEVTLDQHDMPPLLSRLAEAVANQNA